MAAKGRKPQGARRKSMWTDNPNFDPHWDSLWWGKKATDVTIALRIPVPSHAGKPPPYNPPPPPADPACDDCMMPYDWPVRAIDQAVSTKPGDDQAVSSSTKPKKTMVGTPPSQPSASKTSTPCSKPSSPAAAPSSPSSSGAKPQPAPPTSPPPCNKMPSSPAASSASSPPSTSAPSSPEQPASSKHCSPAHAPSPALPSAAVSSSCASSSSSSKPAARDINPSMYKGAWGGGHKDKERRKPWPKAYELSRQFAHHKTDITKGVMIFEGR